MKKEGHETVQVWLTDNEFLEIAKIAHEKDITFNEAVVEILEEHINTVKKEKSDE